MCSIKRLIAISLLIVHNTYGNWGGGPEGGPLNSGTFQPMGVEQVAMVKESLTIDLYHEYLDVEINYTLRNTGDAVTVRAGFPIQTLGDTVSQKDITDYSIMTQSKEIPYTVVKGEKATWEDDYGLMFPGDEQEEFWVHWFVSEINFKKGETKIINITYRTFYQKGAGGHSNVTEHDPYTHTYIMHTGAAWKGPIKEGVVKIRPNNLDRQRLQLPDRFRWSRHNSEYTWRFQNLEPSRKDNIEINLGNGYKKVYPSFGPVEDLPKGYFILQHGQKFFQFRDFKKVTASSYLENKEKYSPAVLMGKAEGTGWVEGKPGSGIGESITITLNEPRRVNKLGILPGFNKSEELFYANNRIAKADIILNEKIAYTKSFFDENVTQWVDFGDLSQKVETIRIVIKEVYKGNTYDDTAISGIFLRQKLSKDFKIPYGR